MRVWSVRACPVCNLLVAMEDSWEGIVCDGTGNATGAVEKHKATPMEVIEVVERREG